MTHKNKTIFGIAVGVFILLVAAGLAPFLWGGGLFGYGERGLFEKIKDKPELVAIYNKAKEREAQIRKESDKASLYLALALDYKSIGELSGIAVFFEKSLKVYEEGIEKFGSKNILFYLNGGNLAERLGDYDKAERYFKKAIEISSADESGYMELAELYEYKMKKSKEEILNIFNGAIGKMVYTNAIIQARASYLRRVEDYQAALEDYKKLSAIFPNNIGFKDVITELEALIKK